MSVKVVDNDSSFQTELGSAGSKLVVVDFYAVWCGPCQRIAPVFEQLAAKYPKALFLKVDVDKCPESASSNGVTAMPTFILFRNKVKVDNLRGADPTALEEKIKKFYSTEGEDESGVKGYMDLTSFIEKNGCECLNEADNHTLSHLLAKTGALESDCDEQLLIHIQFNQPVKLHSLKLSGSPDNGPKVVKLFINQPGSLDFDKADSMEPIQLLVLTADDIANGALIALKFVKFQNVQNVTLFVRENLSGSDKTRIDQLGFIGSPIGATNMSDFKRVTGKKGESH